MRGSLRAAGILAASLVLTPVASAAPAAGGWTSQIVAEAPEEAPAKLNPTGRTYEIEVPLKVDGARLGDVGIKITADDQLFVDAKLLKTYLVKIYRPEVLTAALAAPEEQATKAASASVVSKRAPGAVSSDVKFVSQPLETREPGSLEDDNPSYLSVSVLKERGISMRYDPLNLDLEVLPTVDQRPTSTLSFRQSADEESVTLEQPAYVSAYLNLHLATSYVSRSTNGTTGMETPTIDFDGAVRVGPYVLEGEGTIYEQNSQWLGASSLENYVFYRRGTRLVYDLPDEAIRIRAGDVSPSYTGFQTAPDLLGVSADVAYAQLQPQTSIRPTGAHSFRIERPSNVDIFVDNVMIKHIRLGPGNYNLTDLPLNPGASNVKLVIEDDTGQRQTLEFTGFSGQELLAPGISEWSINAGIKSYDSGVTEASGSAAASTLANTTLVNKSSLYAQRQYFFKEPAATGFYRMGILDWLTADANLQADTSSAMAGAGAALQTTEGLITAKLAASDSYASGPGFAAQLGYDYDKLKWFGYNANLRILGEYRTERFETMGTSMTAADYNAYIAATYAQHLPWDLMAGLSFSYYILDRTGSSDPGDRWQANASLSTQLSDNVSVSASFDYGRDQTSEASSSSAQYRNGFEAFLRLSWTPETHANATVGYDSRNHTVQTTVTQSSDNANIGSWNAMAIADTAANGESDVSASASYFTNRGEFYFNHSASFDGPGYGGLARPSTSEELTSVSVASSLVYADGAWGVGRRVTSGFALVSPHESLQGSPVVIGGTDSPVAETDWLGAAVVPTASPYRQVRLSYDAPGAPAGYDLGSAAFDMKAPYKAGYNLKAGSAYTVTAMGTLLDAEGQPLPLLAGEAREADKENGRKVELFTNRAGRFGAQGLAPGKWIIEMPAESGPVRYTLEIPAGLAGFHNAGTLKPSGGSQQKPPIIEAGADSATN